MRWGTRRARVVLVALLAAIVVAVVAALALWGGASRPRSTPATRSVQRYDRLIGQGDARGACAMLAPQARADIVRAAAPIGRLSCTDVVRALIKRLGADGRKAIADATPRQVWVKAHAARVSVDFGGGRRGTDLLVLRVRQQWLLGPSLSGAR